MDLVSFQYYVFLFVSLLVYYIVPAKFRWMILLVSSVCFYCLVVSKVWSIIYVILTVIVTWIASLVMSRDSNPQRLRRAYWSAVFINIGILFLLKYTNFFLGNASFIVNLFWAETEWRVNWLASLGISFYTLQIVGYLTDCYWGLCKPQRNVLKLALFTCYFPQMISGPISRYSQLSAEIYRGNTFDFVRIRAGLLRIVYGVFKKLVIAENLNVFANAVLNLDCTYQGFILWLGIAAYVLQIYADFSGCMDIVIGTGQCFGITMVENFDKPFSSRSIQEFWQRWHITLGLWLRDYIMYPLLHSSIWIKLGKKLKTKYGKKVAKTVPAQLAALVLWFCMGLWHGGGWNFIAEGLWFWSVIVVGVIVSPYFKQYTSRVQWESKLGVVFQCVRTTIIYAIGAILFRYGSLQVGLTVIFDALLPDRFFCGLFTFVTDIKLLLLTNHYEGLRVICSAMLGFGIMLLFDYCNKNNVSVFYKIQHTSLVNQLLIILCMLYVVIIFGVYGPGYSAGEFIYGGF